MAHFKYRIVKTTYHNPHPSTDWDSGPISPKTEIIWEKEKNQSVTSKYFGKQKVHTQGGWISYIFEIQLFNPENNEWEFVDFLETEDEK